jgi:broad specificity phosphatase PhoE
VNVLWARHGENLANITNTLSHRVYDADLTDLGRAQAEALAEQLAGFVEDPIGLLVCSPMRRARQTADIVGAWLGLPVATELEDLRELNVGALDGRNDAVAWEAYERVLAAWRQGEATVRFPDGEDLSTVCVRLRRALVMVAENAGGARPLVVAHAGNLRAAVSGLTGAPEPVADLPTGGFAELRVDPRSRPVPSVQLLSWSGSGPSPASG